MYVSGITVSVHTLEPWHFSVWRLLSCTNAIFRCKIQLVGKSKVFEPVSENSTYRFNDEEKLFVKSGDLIALRYGKINPFRQFHCQSEYGNYRLTYKVSMGYKEMSFRESDIYHFYNYQSMERCVRFSFDLHVEPLKQGKYDYRQLFYHIKNVNSISC